MIKAGIVEGKGPSSGVIRNLRVICTEEEAIKRLAAVRAAEGPSIEETAGSIMSQASREIFKEPLEGGHFVWQHRRNRRLVLNYEQPVHAHA